jgi:hypothetical protein
MGCEEIIKVFFHMQSAIKLYHWQTTTYARHIATNDLLAGVLPLIDSFIETYIGRYDRPSFKSGVRLVIEEITDDTSVNLIEYYIKFLKNEIPKYVKSSDTDLLAIRDEILALLNKTLYLFTLN